MNVEHADLWVLLLSTARYSMGRMTYMSSLLPEMVLRYREALTRQQLEQIREEVQCELGRCENLGKTLGQQCDHDSWKKFVMDLESLLEAEWVK